MTTTKQVIAEFREKFDSRFYENPKQVAVNPDEVEQFITSKLEERTKEIIELVESRKEEVRHGMDVNYGDTQHAHPSVIYGNNETLDDLSATLKSTYL